jgi:hypothetical protein
MNSKPLMVLVHNPMPLMVFAILNGVLPLQKDGRRRVSQNPASSLRAAGTVDGGICTEIGQYLPAGKTG